MNFLKVFLLALTFLGVKCNCTLAHFFASNQLVTFFRCAHLHTYPNFIFHF